eukprot:TRINITY_DN185_c1_g1_i2.p1 TRINITY_DN185_c1_g1~~TRINITY_DN185_c1_g1_i2.p1  ORF type:complete len:317 (-),score=96.41 TRINITY_DN185_c1_g1_i2:44-994(-)
MQNTSAPSLDHVLDAMLPSKKNGGCNHMMCTQCQYHFCWQCMKKFGSGDKGSSDGYSTHKCNGYYQEDSDIKNKQDEWKRFEWYSERYNNHDKSLRQEMKELELSPVVIADIIDAFNMSWVSAQFYPNALKQLVKNRQTLKFSYAFGFFRPIQVPYVNKNIFENLQVELERHTEQLAFLVQSAKAGTLGTETRSQVLNQTRIAEKLQQSVVGAASDWNNPLKEKSTSTPSPSLGPPAKKGNWNTDRDVQRDRELNRQREEEELARVLAVSKKDFGQHRDEDEELTRAIMESTKDVGRQEDDWELMLALQESMKGGK